MESIAYINNLLTLSLSDGLLYIPRIYVDNHHSTTYVVFCWRTTVMSGQGHIRPRRVRFQLDAQRSSWTAEQIYRLRTMVVLLHTRENGAVRARKAILMALDAFETLRGSGSSEKVVAH